MKQKQLLTIGWREWVHLPDLGLPWLKAKIDTGARTSCLHSFSVEPFIKNDEQWIRFGIHPHQEDTKTEVYCESKVVDERIVTDSGGHQEQRFVISTLLAMGNQQWPIEITLTNRDNMRFRMLLGRTAMQDKVTIDPAASFILGKPPKHTRKQG